MSERRVERLQWFGLLGGPAAFTLHLVLGFYLSQASCGSAHFHTGWQGVQLALTVVAAVIAAAAGMAAFVVHRARGSVDHDAPGPAGRQAFLAAGSMFGDLLFLTAIVLSGLTVVGLHSCRQA